MAVRYVIPDCEEIRNLAEKDPRKRSLEKIFKDAGLCGARLLRDWEGGKKPLRSTLIALMHQLHNCDYLSQITKNDVPTPNTTDPGSPKCSFRMCVLLAVCSREFRNSVLQAGGHDKVGVGDFTRNHFRQEVTSLNLTMAEMDEVLTELCRMGWLRPSESAQGPRYFFRKPNTRQIRDAYYNRVYAEQRGIRHAFFSGRNPADDYAHDEFRSIVNLQRSTLDALYNATVIVRNEPTLENAILVIELDNKLHHGWGGYCPSTSALLTVGMGQHFLQIGRLIVVHKLFETKGLQLPDEYPTLPDIVDNFYTDTSSIFRDFLDAVNAATKRESEEALERLEDAVAKHAEFGYPYVEHADQLIRFLNELE